jgi:3-dehydroquinate synthase
MHVGRAGDDERLRVRRASAVGNISLVLPRDQEGRPSNAKRGKPAAAPRCAAALPPRGHIIARMAGAVRPAAGGERLHARFAVSYGYEVRFTRDFLDPDNPALAEVVGEIETGGAATVMRACNVAGATEPSDATEAARAAEAGSATDAPALMLAAIDDGVLAHHPGLPARLAAYARRHAAGIRLAGPPLVLPGGERVKEDSRGVEAILAAIERRAIDRHSHLLAIGGGALLDVAGYAAAIAHRGVRLVRVPTTTLAQNDAGIGVKNGLNAFGKKNFLGTFAPPFAVIDDETFLTTLSDRDWRAGASEAVKVALLKDAAFFTDLERLAPAIRRRDLDAMSALVRRCAELHLDHIAGGGDPFELGSARPLDFGHWSAHKLERLSGLRLRHGEAVAIGIALDATYSHLTEMLSASEWRRVLRLLQAFGLPLAAPELDHPLLLDGLDEFREHLGGRLTVTLIEAIGAGVEAHRIDRPTMLRAVEELRSIAEPQAAEEEAAADEARASRPAARPGALALAGEASA